MQSKILTKENEKPFTFYERDKNKQKTADYRKPEFLQRFKADEVPWYCSVLLLERMHRAKTKKS